MHRHIVYVFLDQFYVKTALELTPNLANRPVAVVRDKVVIDANDLARRLGIVAGTASARAKVLGGGELHLVPWNGDVYVTAQENWLSIAAKHSGLIEPNESHDAWIDLTGHPDPVYVAHHCIARIQKATHLALRHGSGTSKWMSRLSASIDGSQYTPLQANELAELSTECLLPISSQSRERLTFLGYKRIGDMRRIPLRTLQEQFGEEGVRIHLAVRGSLRDFVQPGYPPQIASECRLFADRVESMPEIEHVFRDMARCLGERLEGAQMIGREIELEITFESNKIRRVARKFSRPVACFRTAFVAMQLLFGEEFPEAIIGVRVILPKLEKFASYQPAIEQRFNTIDRAPKLLGALDHARTTVGEQAVIRGEDVSIPRRKRLLGEWQRANGWF